jgi:hypothetical protein
MKKDLVGLLELETAELECFFGKWGLSPLGVKSGITLQETEHDKHYDNNLSYF